MTSTNSGCARNSRKGLAKRRTGSSAARGSRVWPEKSVPGDWDSDSDENVIESVTLTFDFFELSAP